MGKRILKKHKEVIENGIISCSNHVHLWDYFAIMFAIRPKRPNTIAWAKILEEKIAN